MEAFAKEFGIPRDGDDECPEDVMKKGVSHNIIDYVGFCITDAFQNNPYRAPTMVYLLGALAIVYCVVSRCIFAIEKSHMAAADYSKLDRGTVTGNTQDATGTEDWIKTREKIQDANAVVVGMLPVSVSLMFFFFPPLLGSQTAVS